MSAETSDNLVNLKVAAARMYYEHGMTHQEISQELHLSRVKVTRLLAKARDEGIVQIKVIANGELFDDLRQQLTEIFGLDDIWISPISHDPERNRHSMALTGAEAITHLVNRSSRVAVGLSRTLASAAACLSPIDPGASEIRFIPTSGSLGTWLEGKNASELASKLADLFDGRAMGLPVPLIAPSPTVAQSFATMPEVSYPLDYIQQADVAFFGVGPLDWESSPLSAAMSEEEREELIHLGAIGDVSGRFFNAAGNEIHSQFNRRVTSLSLASYQAIKSRVLFACGENKIRSMLVLLRSSFVTGLVTDSSTARLLINSHRHTGPILTS